MRPPEFMLSVTGPTTESSAKKLSSGNNSTPEISVVHP
jgi:hypothetical protein